MRNKIVLMSLIAATFLLGGCNYDVALTARPTRKIDERLLGVWLGGEDGKDRMVVRQLDDSHYVVAMDDDLYCAHHSDFGGIPFLSVQELNGDREFVYLTAEAPADGRQLRIRVVNTRIVPDETKGRAALQKLIKANLGNPNLFNDPVVFTRKK